MATSDAADAGSAPPSLMETALSEWRGRTQCDAFDYKANGGIQNFWCHRPSRITFAAVQALAGVDVFASGPHSGGSLDLDDSHAFGHYNPAFVQWLLANAGPSPRGSVAQRATQSAYDAHLKPLATIFWTTYAKAVGDPACFAREKASYAAAIARKKLPKDYYERWFYYMNPWFCSGPPGAARPDTFYFDNGMDAGVDGNVTKTVVGFWLRRSMDGTMDAFVEGLKKLIASYDPDLLTTPYRGADPAEPTKAIDLGVKAAAACKTAGAKSAMTPLDVVVAADGQLHARPSDVAAAKTAEGQCITAAFERQKVTAFTGDDLRFSRTVSTTLKPIARRVGSPFDAVR